MLKAFLKDEFAATAIEYGLIAAGISSQSSPWSMGLGPAQKHIFVSLAS